MLLCMESAKLAGSSRRRVWVGLSSSRYPMMGAGGWQRWRRHEREGNLFFRDQDTKLGLLGMGGSPNIQTAWW